MVGAKVLVIDDDKEIAELVRDYLEVEGYEIFLAFDGEEGIQKFENLKPDLAIIDIMLPKVDGMEICRRFRADSTIPILMLSAKTSDTDKILGLGIGADDYVTKPFSPGELVARVKAQLRRYKHLSTTPNQEKKLLRFKELEIDIQGYNVYLAGQEVSLSAKEFDILKLLAMNPNQVFTKEQIFNQVWGFEEYGDISTVTVHIRKIREKIEQEPSDPRYIKTVWGVGYKLDGGN